MALRVKINPEKIPDRNQPLSIHKLGVAKGGVSLLRDISFEVAPGEILGIVGAKGSGKTTLVSTIAGTINVPTKNIEYSHALHDGYDLFTLSPEHRYAQGIHCVFQGRRLFGSLSVRDNLSVAMPFSARKKITARIDEVTDLIPKLKDLLDIKAVDCTAGQQYIVAIARSVMVFPSVLILDEPTHGLSLPAIEAVKEFLEVLITGSMGVVVLEQRSSFVDDIAHRRLDLRDGKLMEPLAESSRATEWKPEQTAKPLVPPPLIESDDEEVSDDDEWKPK